MKNALSSLLVASALVAPAAFAQTATTTPVGYVTETLKAGQFNLVGLTTHQPVIASGVIDAETTNSVTDNEVNFTNTLTAGATYVLELDGGVTQEVTAWSANAITTPNLTSFITPGTTSYKLRKAPTISDIFGATNTAGLLGSATFNPNQSDVIYIPNGSGGFDRYFYSTHPSGTGWYTADTLVPSSNVAVVYADGLLIQRRGATDLNVVFSGEIKKVATTLILISGQFNYVGGVYPVGSTLANSGLSSGLTPTASFNPSQADLVYIPDGAGGYNRYFYSTHPSGTGWFNAADLTPSDAVSLKSGVVILRRGATTTVTLTPPAGYSGL